MRWIVENHLTDNVLGLYEADSAREAIDKAYQARGWKDFADARNQRATAAEEHEIKARQVDDNGVQFGPFVGYSEA